MASHPTRVPSINTPERPELDEGRRACCDSHWRWFLSPCYFARLRRSLAIHRKGEEWTKIGTPGTGFVAVGHSIYGMTTNKSESMNSTTITQRVNDFVIYCTSVTKSLTLVIGLLGVS
jgi:hypothetical protein